MPRAREDDDREGEAVRRITARAIRRLDLLEYAILGAAAVLALVAGALAALLLTGVGVPFHTTWIVASLLFFVVPAGAAWWRNRGGGRDPTEPDAGPGGAEPPGGPGS